jgi:phosphatidate phosphatase PAH1
LPGSPQWVLAKFAYGPEDKDIEDENVAIYVLRDCGTSWESAGTFRTTTEGSHAEVLGVADQGGQIYVDLAKVLPGGPLGIGRHRVHLVVPGDGSVVDLYLEVLAPGARIAVSDIDGTLTESENAVVWDVLTDDKAGANPGAADVMKELSGRGFYMFYLTARPHWLEPTTRKWLTMRGFPPGIVHTSLTATGRTGPEAAAFKSGELSLLKQATGLVPALGFGNMPSDVIAYSNAGLSKAGTFFFKLAENANGAVVHDDYRTLVPKLSVLPKSCP